MSKLFGALMAVGVVLFILAEGVRSRDWRDMVRTGLWVGLPYAAVVALFVVAFSAVSGDFIAAVLGHHLQQGRGTPAPQVIDKALLLYWQYITAQPLLWALAAAGVVAVWRGAPERRVFAWQLPTLLAFLGMTRDLQARHFTYAVPSLVICAAVGLAWLLGHARRLWPWGRSRWLLSAPAIALVVIVLAPQLGHNAWVRSWAEHDHARMGRLPGRPHRAGRHDHLRLSWPQLLRAAADDASGGRHLARGRQERPDSRRRSDRRDRAEPGAHGAAERGSGGAPVCEPAGLSRCSSSTCRSTFTCSSARSTTIA